jgi:hypothetical protein
MRRMTLQMNILQTNFLKMVAAQVALCLSLTVAWAGPTQTNHVTPEQLNKLPPELADSYRKNKIERVRKFSVCGLDWVYLERLRGNTLEVKKRLLDQTAKNLQSFDLEDSIIDAIEALQCSPSSTQWVVARGHFGLHSSEIRVFTISENQGAFKILERKMLRGASTCNFDLKQKMLTLRCDDEPSSTRNEIGEVMELAADKK